MALIKPPVLPTWAESGDQVQPSNAEIQVGWPLSNTPPARQRFNWLLNYLMNGVRYFARRGLPDYDAAETYKIGDRVIGDDGKTYRSLQDANVGNTPSTATAWWERWGFTKAELTAELNNHDYKDSCRVATTANLAALSGLLTVDGVVLVAGNRVLVKDQTTGSQNGIYVVAAGAWSRAADFDENSEVTAGAVVPVTEGSSQADTLWMLTTDDPITVGVTSLSFSQSLSTLFATKTAVQNNSYCVANAGGTADAITGTYTPAVTALTGGLTLYVRAASSNATTTPTFSPNGLTAKTIVKGANQVLSIGDIAGSGHWVELQYDSTLDKWVLLNPATGVAASGLPQNYLTGLTTATNAGAATTKIDIAAGRCRSDDNTTDIVLAATLTKQLNAAWVAGNNGGLDTGAVAANTGYHVWMIYNPTSGISDALFSTSATAPTMPGGYTKKRRIGWIRTDGSSLIKGFTQIDDTFIWKTPGLDVNGSAISAGAGALYTLPVPGGIKVTALFNLQSSGPDAGVYVHSPDADAMYPPTTPTATPPLSQLSWTGSNPEMTAGYYAIPTNTSSQVRVDSSSSWTETIYLGTLGWVDTRGRLS